MVDNTRSRLRNEVDRLSELPDPILHKIFSDLPTKQAIRASVLSKRWKNFWLSLPNLSFDVNETRKHRHLARNAIYKRQRYSSSLYRLHLHLWNYGPERFDWCVCFSQIKELSITLDLYARILPIPSEIFTSSSISVFKLRNLMARWDLEIKLPRSLLSAAGLKILELDNVPTDTWREQDLVFRWPILENLVLVNCFMYFPHSVKISAPQLKTLVVDNVFKDLRMRAWANIVCQRVKFNVPNLLSFVYSGELDVYNIKFKKLSKLVSARLCACFVEYSDTEESDLEEDKTISLRMTRVLKHVSNATTLALEDFEVLPLEEKRLMGKTLKSFTKLKTLELTTRICEAGFIVSKCSCITTLILFLTHTVEFNDKESEEMLPWPKQCSLNNLKYVAVRWVCGLDRELQLLEFLLNNASALERMTVTKYSKRGHTSNFERALRENLMKFGDKLLKLSQKFSAVELSFNTL